MLTPRLESVVAEKKGEVLLAKVDIDENTDLALDYQVLVLLRAVKAKIVDVLKNSTLHNISDTRNYLAYYTAFKSLILSCGKLWVGFAVNHFCYFSRFNLRWVLFCNCWLWKLIFFNIYFRSHWSDILCHCTVIDACSFSVFISFHGSLQWYWTCQYWCYITIECVIFGKICLVHCIYITWNSSCYIVSKNTAYQSFRANRYIDVPY